MDLGFVGGLRDATRMLVRHPGLSATTIAALAMGIGFTTIMFSVVYAVLLRELPVEDGERIVKITLLAPASGIPGPQATMHDYTDWRTGQSTFEELAAYREGSANVRGPSGPVRYSSALVTANALASLRLNPVAGRLFEAADDDPDAPATVVLSHHVREELFSGSAEAVGATVTVNGEAAEVIGILPEGFRFPVLQDIWLPLRTSASEVERGGGAPVSVFGRLATGITLDEATADLSGIVAELHAAYPETSPDATPLVETFVHAGVVKGIVPLFWAMLVIAALVLLIACANAANLLLLRAAAGARETAVRRAMGAHRGQIAYRMMAEASALALLGALLGTSIAWTGISLFASAAADTPPPFWVVFEFDGTVFLFLVAVAGAATLLSGVPPVLKVAGRNAGLGRTDEFESSSPLRIGKLSRWMVACELAMSMGLLVAAGLMTRSLATLNGFDYGFEHESVLTARITMAEADFPTAADRRGFYRAVQQGVAGIPEVQSAALGSSLPALGAGMADIAIEGERRTGLAGGEMTRWVEVSPGYFAAFAVGIVEGRDFGAGDTADSAPVAIVNISFVSRYLGDGATGRRIRVGDAGSASWRTVVGVVPDLFMGGVDAAGPGADGVYTPLSQGTEHSIYVLAANPTDPLTLTPAVRAAVIALNANTPIHAAERMSDLLARETLFYRIFGTLFVAFGVAALFLAAVGLYGVVSFTVRQRRIELGLRMILGAGAPEILRLILRQGMAPMSCGLVLGTGLGLLISLSLRMALFEVSPYDPLSFALAAGLLIGVGTLAVAVPALIASRIDPVEALRTR